MVRVMDGGWTFSRSASSRGVIGPWTSRTASTEYWPGVTSSTLRSWRSRREVRMTAMRSSTARDAIGVRVGVVGAGDINS